MQGKDLFQSSTTWGILIGVLAQILALLGVELEINQEVTANNLATIVGAAISLYGNINRKTVITSIAGKKLNKEDKQL